MPYNGSGVYAAPSSSFNPAVSGNNADPTDWNSFLADLSTALSTCILRNGNGVPTSDIPFGGYKITSYGTGSAPSARSDVPAVGQIQDGQFTWAGTAGGTNNVITLTPTPAITAYATGQKFRFISGASPSDDAVTINVSSVGAKAVQYAGSAMSASNVIAASKIYEITYDGTAFQINKGTAVAFGTGDVTGPASSTDEALARFDGTGGKTLQNSGWTLTDAYLMTAAGTLAMADNLITRPKFTDYGETVNALGSIGGGSQDIDITLGNVVSGTVDTSETTFTFSNPSATGTSCSFTLILTNGGSQTVNWPAAVDWTGGAAPSLTASGVDVLTFFTLDAGTIWYGFPAGLAMA
jgi:hypothetical protein